MKSIPVWDVMIMNQIKMSIKKFILKIAAWGIMVVFMLCCSCTSSDRDIKLTPTDYQALLDALLTSPEYDPYLRDNEVNESPFTKALIMSAEALRYAGTRDSKAKSNVRNLAQWVIDHADDDKDGVFGWGLGFEWDAFADGTVNGAFTPYTIDTALILDALLDAYRLLSSTQKKQVSRIFHDTVMAWITDYWSDEGDGGWFWYSISPHDAIFTPNVSSMMTGVLARLVYEYPDIFEPDEISEINSKIDRSVRYLMIKRIGGDLRWQYSAVSQDTLTDLVHQMYILLGLEYCRFYHSSAAVTYATGDAVNNMLSYSDGHKLYEYDEILRDERDEEWIDRGARNWAIGAWIEFMSRYDNKDKAAYGIETLKSAYGSWPQITLYRTDEYDTDQKFYPRFAVHVLKGLAYCYWYDGTT